MHVVPGSAAPGIGGFDPWRGALTVRVAAQAREGQANAEACRRLAEALSVESARVSVASGARSREKTLRVEGLRAEEVRTRLEALP